MTATSRRSGARSVRPWANSADTRHTAASSDGRAASAARSSRNWSPWPIGPAWAAGANSHTPAVSVGSSQPSLRMRSATTLGSVPIPVRVARAASSATVTTWGASSSNSVSIGPSEGGIVRVIVTHKVSDSDTDASSMTPILLTHLRMSTDWYMYQIQILESLC